MDEERQGLTNGHVVAIAGAASGVAATVLAALDRGDRREPPVKLAVSVPEPIEQSARQMAKSGDRQLRSARKATRRSASEARRMSRTAGHEGRETVMKAKKSAIEKLDEAREAVVPKLDEARKAAGPKLDEARARTVDAVTTQATSAKRRGEAMVAGKGAEAVSAVSAAVVHGGHEAARLAHEARERGAKAKDEMTSRVGDAAHRGRDAAQRGGETAQRVVGTQAGSAQSAAQAVVAMAAERAVAAAERAKEAGVVVGETAKERAPQLTHKFEDEVVPSLREIALNAASAALDLWDAAQDRATKAAGTAQHDLVPKASHALAIGEERAKEATAAVAERAGHVGERAKSGSKHAADATVDASKDTGAAFFWAAAAGGLVYYVLLSKERREQVLRVAQTVTGQARELVNDFRGYDAEFT